MTDTGARLDGDAHDTHADVPDHELTHLLKLLALPRAGIAVPNPGNRAPDLAVESEIDGAPSHHGAATRAAIAAALERGWVDLAPGGRWRITKVGLGEYKLRRADESLARIAASAAPPPVDTALPIPLPVMNDAESPLTWLRKRRDKAGRPLITAVQLEAGERLRADYTRGQLMPRVTARWSGSAASGQGRRATPGVTDITDSALAARQRVDRALLAIGSDLAGILIDVCCHLRGIEEVEENAGLPRRAGKVLLGSALNALARHYGLIRPETEAATIAQRITGWSVADMNPNIDAWRRR